MRHALRKDDIEPEVVKALRAIGAKVEIIGQPLDLLVWHRGRTMIVECKDEDGRLNKKQVEFIASWPGEIHVVRSPQEAVNAVLNGGKNEHS